MLFVSIRFYPWKISKNQDMLVVRGGGCRASEYLGYRIVVVAASRCGGANVRSPHAKWKACTIDGRMEGGRLEAWRKE
jgi:hypothetical protein